ncbi:potassium transporter Kup [Kushneria phyllosphaerae]|uniref:Probable potassium transport system protein Kup n=1 Tax=Kushneria phyllosphaerae TaxID=2100822 RepID=A0A2R8CGW1_9GAMM|nr:potassium transporter Kup [Kushneria phyllosphaerae]SPJ32135.1 Low affinity potassium transport system protein kup [Kushneria phyllosphaerae]
MSDKKTARDADRNAEEKEEALERASSRSEQEQIAQPYSHEEQAESSEAEERSLSTKRLFVLGLAALGVSYGDIGTSPLYALRECFRGSSNLLPSDANVMGILSLIFWALILVVSTKYMLFVTRANNNGEGGMLALVALLNPWRKNAGRHSKWLLQLGVFGTALLYGSFMLTPAISVSSAVEGLNVATTIFEPYVIPITIAILVMLFAIQSRGTETVGRFFGPVMIVWFVTLALLGVYGIVQEPSVLKAINPLRAVEFFTLNRWTGFVVLGAVFLVVTGGEAMYADMGHFGRRPIQLAWFGLVLPALLLNYYGQGAMLIHSQGQSAAQPFYNLAPDWALYPLVVLSTVATVIASQAVISGAFSLTRQAVQLGQLPPMRLFQTSSEEYGQIYVPTLNWLLMLATIGLVLGFRTSTNLAWAYGVGISFAMTITTILAFFIMRERWKWSMWVAGPITVAFLMVDLPFFGANLLKVPHGGWFPVLTAVVMFTLMGTWRRGGELLRKRLAHDEREQDEEQDPLKDFVAELAKSDTIRVKGTAIFLTSSDAGTLPMLQHHLQLNHVLHERVLLLTVRTEDSPRIPAAERLEIENLGQEVYRVIVRYGFMQTPNVPVAVRFAEHFGIEVDMEQATFYVGRATIIPTDEVEGMMLWREKLFAFMSRNAIQPTSYYKVPPQRVIELGLRVEI